MTKKSLIMFGDRSYAKQKVFDIVTDMGLSNIFVGTGHLETFHPFVT